MSIQRTIRKQAASTIVEFLDFREEDTQGESARLEDDETIESSVASSDPSGLGVGSNILTNGKVVRLVMSPGTSEVGTDYLVSVDVETSVSAKYGASRIYRRSIMVQVVEPEPEP